MKSRILFLLSVFLLLLGNHAVSQEAVALWPDAKNPQARKVTLTPYIAEENPRQMAVIVCPGGSYYWLDEEGEGDEVARWLQSNGITAFVLRYRTAGVGAFIFHPRLIFRGNRHPDMISDAQCALEWVREHAENYHIDPDPDKVGMMGFSAGGHLVMSAACFNQHNFLKDNGMETYCNLCPTFVAPIYPVVTMTENCVHKRSRRGLLGDNKQCDPTLRDSLSLERHIPDNCPPVFLVNCVDDPVVDYHNSILLDSALTVHHVNHQYLQYKTGGHGFGASEVKGSEECHQWKNEFLKWINELL